MMEKFIQSLIDATINFGKEQWNIYMIYCEFMCLQKKDEQKKLTKLIYKDFVKLLEKDKIEYLKNNKITEYKNYFEHIGDGKLSKSKTVINRIQW